MWESSSFVPADTSRGVTNFFSELQTKAEQKYAAMEKEALIMRVGYWGTKVLFMGPPLYGRN